MRNKLGAVLLAGMLTLGVVGCSEDETADITKKIEEGSASLENLTGDARKAAEDSLSEMRKKAEDMKNQALDTSFIDDIIQSVKDLFS
ncbi:MAG: hypothetical protein HQL54_14465 [Magnetococcales bacterium]|nr:hypothetical protein [Magnetococcales bacterium]